MVHEGALYFYEGAYKLLESQKYTDFVIRCEGQDFSVHRLIIYYKSEYFRAILDNDFKEKTDGVLELKETTPSAVATVILFCYTNCLLSTPGNETALVRLATSATIENVDEEQHVSDLVDVYLLADRLLLARLKREACLAVFNVLTSFRVGDGITESKENKVTSLVRCMYNKLPAGDDMLRPALTGWLIANLIGRSGAKNILALAREEDTVYYTAALLGSQSKHVNVKHLLSIAIFEEDY